MAKITSPKEYFGFEIGSEGNMFGYKELVGYVEEISKQTDLIRIDYMEKTLDGNELIAVIVSSSKNLEKLDYYKEISNKLSDPEGLSESEIDTLTKEGKAICVCTLSLHSHEIGGTQMSPLLLYELVTNKSEKFKNILENVIFIMFPTANPDGLEINNAWNKKYKGTKHEKKACVREYNRYASHANNRDGMYHDLIETKCFAKYFYQDFHANALLDFHHAPSYHNRLFLEPSCDPLREELNPLLVREIEFYGNGIACFLEEQNIPNVVTELNDLYGEEFTTTNYFNMADSVKHHNIIGITFEAAHIPGAYGMYVSKEDSASKGSMPSMKNPHPWEGGWWSLYDIVKEDMLSVIGMLNLMAQNKNQLLKNGAIKAIRQTERGKKSEDKAYIIPKNQHDLSSLNRFIKVLLGQRIKFFVADEDIKLSYGKCFEKGSIVVPLAQPKFSVVSVLLRKRDVPDNRYTRRSDGTFLTGDMAASNVAGWMGLDVFAAKEEVKAKMHLYNGEIFEEEKLLVTQNESYKKINKMLLDGKKVFQNGDEFYVGFSGEKEVKKAKIALMSVDVLGYDSWAYCNHTLTKYNTNHTLLRGEDIANGHLSGFDVLILPGYNMETLLREDLYDNEVPDEIKIGLGKKGLDEIKKFVKSGKRVVGWGKTCEYFKECFNLDLEITTLNLSQKEYQTGGSLLNVTGKDHKFMRGMPQKFEVVNFNDFAFLPKSEDNYTAFVKYNQKDVLSNGLLVGEEYIAGKDCAVSVKYGDGEIVMFGFDAQFRSQAEGTFKLFLNTLYLD